MKVVYPYVEVIWQDAATDQGWKDQSDIDEDPELAMTRGWVVRENEVFVWIAATVDEQGTHTQRIKVPVAMIKSRKEIQAYGKRKPRGAGKPKDANTP